MLAWRASRLAVDSKIGVGKRSSGVAYTHRDACRPARSGGSRPAIRPIRNFFRALSKSRGIERH
jgi:hypothetical protein